jgi:hypothetical protein
MTTPYRRLCEGVPARRAAPAGALACEPRALRAWVAALPMANFAAAVRRLLDALDEFNARQLEGMQRLDVLEILRGAAAPLIAATDRQIVGASFPLPPAKADLGELALAFQHAFATGYRAALAELCAPAGSVPFLRSKQVALAAVRALQHGGEHLARAYLLYRMPPAGSWQALHATHAFAASLRLDTREVDDPLQPDATFDARTVYVQALLFALANPYRYTQREQGEVAALVAALAPHVPLRERNGGPHDVRIDTAADRGPGYLPEERVDGQRDLTCLHLDGLLALLDEQLAAAPPGARALPIRRRGAPALHVDLDLLRRLAGAWGARTERGHARLGGGYLLDSVFGLQDLHFVLAGEEDFATFLGRVRGEAISLSEADRRANWRTGMADPGRAVRLPARVLDQGLGGYRVLWEQGAGVRARVSELVGLGLPDGDAGADWLVGVIRWLRIDEHGRVDAGIELLARRALPAGARAPEGARDRMALRALLLAPLDGDPGAAHDAVLTPTEIARETPALELSVPADLHGMPQPARTLHAAPLRLLEANGLYQHFSCSPRASAAATATSGA